LESSNVFLGCDLNLARLKPLQRSFLKSLLSKLLIFPALFFFVLALLPIGDPLPIYIMLTLFDWLCFLICLIGAVGLEMVVSKPELRRSLTHIERGKPKEQKKGEKKKWYQKKEKKLPLY
jgi:hypothetical protein